MKVFSLLLFLLLWRTVSCNNVDRFNYRNTEGTDYGPEDWDRVSCGDVGECQGWPDGWELGVGWELGSRNRCQWCPADGNHDCGLHRQSPIDLMRTAAETGHDTECYDYHWMVCILYSFFFFSMSYSIIYIYICIAGLTHLVSLLISGISRWILQVA
jgi:hypothetical protein